MRKSIIPDSYVEVNDLRAIQQMLVRLLADFHEICEKHGLTYNLFAGTMIGAVRHRGMIPWDNDIDVTMPRSDYEKFVHIIRKEYSEMFHIYSYFDENYGYPFGKFALKDTILIEINNRDEYRLGLYLDIFPVDGYPTEDEKGYFRTLAILKYMRSQNISKLRVSTSLVKKLLFPIKALIVFVCRLFPVSFYLKREVALAKRYKYASANYVILQSWNQKGKLEKRIYEDRALYEFEGIKAWGIRDYDQNLRNYYGDYWQMPPESERIPNHDNLLYAKKELLDHYK